MLIISCDPGLTGALALLDSQRGLLECEDIPTCGNGTASGSMRSWVDAEALQNILCAWSRRHEFAQRSVRAAIERPIPMPKLPAQTVASQFDTFGVLRALIAMKVGPGGMHMVNPQAWKRFFGLDKEKDESRACCLRLYPSAPVTLVKHHNRAEAILIGHWLLREIA